TRLAGLIRARALAWSVAWADREEIDALNILEATMLAMRRALLALPVCPTHVKIDGNRCPCLEDLAPGCTFEAIVDGDATVAAISAASILAKTYRDAMMQALDACYPGFELSRHKGYGTPAHLKALRRRAPSPLHRRSFSPMRRRACWHRPDVARLLSPAPAQRILAERQRGARAGADRRRGRRRHAGSR